MRIFLSSLFISAHLLCSSLPAIGAVTGSSSTSTSIQANHEIPERAGGRVLALPSNAEFLIQAFCTSDTFEAGSRACKYQAGIQIEQRTYVHAAFLSPSYIFEGVKSKRTPKPTLYPILILMADAYLPSALRLTGVFQGSVASKRSPADFWEMAKEYEKTLQDYVPRLLSDAASYFKSTKFTDITFAMHHIVDTTATFRDNIKGALDAHHITFDALTEELEGIFMVIVKDLEKIPPPDKAPGHAERAEMVDNILDDTSVALVKVATRYGIEEEVVTTYLVTLRPHLHALTVAVGDINEQHPQLLPAIAFSVVALLIPESWILRPFLSLLGFGPAGPVKGSAAAWLQRRFWGVAVDAGSWFSWLQKAGMGIYPKWAGLATKVPLLVGGLLAMLLPCFNRG
ncbi:hypothetical protein J3R83DRAFT_2327 [Lanmaoa asiatica]|nr:hypothetical protein J3R83DRAFT_2327 [Lanmaoa asiatica]